MAAARVPAAATAEPAAAKLAMTGIATAMIVLL
jgi:hypothetical protein